MATVLLALSYFIWGLFPLYWKQLAHISSVEILCHRILWSSLFYGLAMVAINLPSREKTARMMTTLRFESKLWSKLFLSSVVITANWFLYIYAVNSGQILQGSLAYYISPLFSVLVGTLFFKEPLSRWTQLALLFCGLGVLVLIAGPSVLDGESPQVPWLALTLAITFFTYGFIKKSVLIPVITSSFIEGLFFALPSAYYIFFSSASVIDFYTTLDWILLVAGGAVTGLPLVFFSYGSQKLPLSTVGFFQYLSPTLQLLTAVFIYSEEFHSYKIAAFAFIWLGVGLYIAQLVVQRGSAGFEASKKLSWP